MPAAARCGRCLAEIDYALGTLQLDGVGLLTNYEGVYLGDHQLDPVFDELHRRKTVVFLHPTLPACVEHTALGYAPSLIEFVFDTTERAKLTNQSVGYLVDYLEEHGYVERRPDPTNRRATLVCFTDRGWDEADACARILDHLNDELTRRLGADRLHQLQALLADATDALHDST